MIEIGLGHYLSLGAIIFFLGVMGIFLNRKNVIVILMSIELILLAVNINLISFSIFSSLMVITSRSTINSVFFLILDFISVGCLFIMVGAEFLGMILLIVYVGAVAVLFLFVVMMLNVAEQKQSWFIGKKSTHIPTGLIVSVLILLELLVVVGGWKYKEDVMSSSTLVLSNISNTHQLGLVMYTDYILYFQLAGVVLLLAMIGAILLTFRERVGVKKQSYFTQISRNPSTAVELKDVKSNEGVKLDD